MAIPNNKWAEFEEKSWNELSAEGDLGEVRFKQRVRAKAEAAGFSAEEIQEAFRAEAARMKEAEDKGYTTFQPMR